ncbi:MAG: PQQ-binding-like beta-propeller repeat protein, partial [Vicinamibacterales bacterium]
YGTNGGNGGNQPYPADAQGVPPIRYVSEYGVMAAGTSPPYSTLTAYDLNTGTIKWQIPAGGDDVRAVAAGGKDTGFISQRTGIITTSSGLLFPAGGDAMLRVYDSETAQVLWSVELPSGSRGIPAMYEVNGRVFFVVNATSATEAGSRAMKPGTPRTRGYVAFALPAGQ